MMGLFYTAQIVFLILAVCILNKLRCFDCDVFADAKA